MLVLSRKLGEKIFINNNICVTVVDIDRGKIRLGIEAPREVPIFRKEVFEAIHGIGSAANIGTRPSTTHGNPGAEPTPMPVKPVETKRVHGDCPTCTCK